MHPEVQADQCEGASCIAKLNTSYVYVADVQRACDADNVELGTACGKLHRVSVLAITDAGECYTANGMLDHYAVAAALTPHWYPLTSWPPAAAELSPHSPFCAGDSDIIKTQPGAEQAAA